MANFSQILSVASLGWGKCCIRFWGRSDQNCGNHGNINLPLIYNGQNGIPVFSQLPLIGSLSNLQVTRAGIKPQMSWIWASSDFSLWSYLPLSVLIDFELGKCCLHLFSVTMNSVFIKLTGNEDRHKILDEFEFRSYLTSHFGVMCPWVVKKMSPAFLSHLDWIFVKLAGNEERHKSSIEFEFGLDRIITLELFVLERRFFFP